MRRLEAPLLPLDDVGAGGAGGGQVKVGLGGAVVEEGEDEVGVAEPVDEVVVAQAAGVGREEDGFRGGRRVVDDEESRVGQADVGPRGLDVQEVCPDSRD